MKLDNKEQQQLLLQIVSTTGMHGNYQQVKEAIKLVDKLIEDIQSAEIILEDFRTQTLEISQHNASTVKINTV